MLLLKLRYKHGRLIDADSKHPVLMNDNRLIWFVYTGKVDVFAVKTKENEIAGIRYHLFRCEAGQMLFGIQSQNTGVSLLAVGVPGTRLLRVDQTAIQQLLADPNDRQSAAQIAPLVEQWVSGLSSGLTIENPPHQSELLKPIGEVTVEAQRAVGTRELLWIKHLEGESNFLGVRNLAHPGKSYLPITTHTWLETNSPSRLAVLNTVNLMRQGENWLAIDEFHQLAMQSVAEKIGRSEQMERQRLNNKAEANQRFVQNAFRRLTSVLETDKTLAMTTTFVKPNPLLAACQEVGRTLKIHIMPAQESSKQRRQATYDPLRAIMRASRLRYRQVALRGKWWCEDHGPLIAFTRVSPEDDAIVWDRAVAIIPKGSGHYLMVEPILEHSTPVTEEIATRLTPFAYVLYRPFPEQSMSAIEMVRFGLFGSKADIGVVLAMGVGIGLLGTLPPLLTSTLFNTIIPAADRDQLWQFAVGLLLGAIGILLFQITRNVAVLRVEGRLSAALQTATWDRVLRLPTTFFREYAAGDLAERALGIDQIRKILFRTTLTTIMAAIFSLFNYGLLFYYNSQLAWVATVVVLAAIMISAIAGYAQVRHQRKMIALQGELSGMVLQFISGIPKFRVAGAEGWAFTRWAKKFSQQKRFAYLTRAIENNLAVFHAMYPIIAAMAIFGAVAYWLPQGQVATGAFLGFNAAFVQFLFITLAVSTNLISVLRIVPMYERARPILQTLPEVSETKADPGEINGEIEVSNLAFHYKETEPPILSDVSLHINPGEFVALVGPSGSGKSTLVRLLLGFEKPTAGAIYYDAQDFSELDVEAVRRQIGVVLQDGKLFAGDIFSNIVGALPLKLDDAWDAAKLVGIDEDIRAMPMQMNTQISEGGTNLSSGQRQRLLIARAIVTRPRILFFDEATSALDNRTQSIVSESLERLRSTRVVIAHRLSTIQHADRIIVLHQGKIVQSGTYAELMRQGGVFADMARRQIV